MSDEMFIGFSWDLSNNHISICRLKTANKVKAEKIIAETKNTLLEIENLKKVKREIEEKIDKKFIYINELHQKMDTLK